MRQIIDSLIGRIALIVSFGIVSVQFSSQWIYESTLSSEAEIANQERLADRIVSLHQTLINIPSALRDKTAHEQSGGALEAHWGPRPRVVSSLVSDWQILRSRLLENLRPANPDDVIVGLESATSTSLHLAAVSIRFPDQSWLNVGILAPHYHPPRSWLALLTTSLVAIAILLVSIFFVRRFTRPLERMAEAARGFHVSSTPVAVDEDGPLETRTLAVAFNDMQKRVQMQVSARTHALAAVSHDLRTPLSRARLRIEAIDDEELQASFEHDFAEMDRMIEATLNYLKGARASEEVQPVELTALVNSIVDEASDMGHGVKLISPQTVVVHGRRLALKRALSNLLQNAIKYGREVELVLSADSAHAKIAIADRGPGVPEKDIKTLCEPFVRLDESRNSETGGFGLGLTIAHEIIQGHGGNLELRNRDGGGFEAIVTLPRPFPTATFRNTTAKQG